MLGTPVLFDPFVYGACVCAHVRFVVYGSSTIRLEACWIRWFTASPISECLALKAHNGVAAVKPGNRIYRNQGIKSKTLRGKLRGTETERQMGQGGG